MAYSLESFARARTMVLWDTVECPIPENLDADTVVKNINKALRGMGYHGIAADSVRAYCDVTDPEIGEAFYGIPMKHLPAELNDKDKEERRTEILVDLMYQAIGDRDPLNLVLIIGDISKKAGFFTAALRFLNNRNNINLLVAQHPGNDVSERLLQVVTSVWTWSSLSHGGYPIGLEETDSE